jgi:hypothetical protein
MQRDSQSMDLERVAGNPGQGECPGASARGRWAAYSDTENAL